MYLTFKTSGKAVNQILAHDTLQNCFRIPCGIYGIYLQNYNSLSVTVTTKAQQNVILLLRPLVMGRFNLLELSGLNLQNNT